jgi:hypothetical protein
MYANTRDDAAQRGAAALSAYFAQSLGQLEGVREPQKRPLTWTFRGGSDGCRSRDLTIFRFVTTPEMAANRRLRPAVLNDSLVT